jgi:hypothetical protein
VEKGRHTSQNKQNNPVHDQDGPEDGDIKDGEPAAQEANGDGAGGGVPELELGEPADEGTELVVLLCGEAGGSGVAVFETLVLCEGGVELGLEEEEEEV